MGRQAGSDENKLRGYKAAVTNSRVSDEARSHAQQEIDQLSSSQDPSDRHEANMKRGLQAAMHNSRVTEKGRSAAQSKLDEMSGPAE
ncbi:hypothetical protein N7462_001348 [Penicillium macrosclerotiorum]|uniref:uncharacterized protein n=1 Tax=Penicillium macrosclerotiorum TaxID=303699 RepID=UPI002548C9E1|nr:uncharacterized protein N7462_001348 [Penicillium macrosclerotiorum]KAJ5691925.1 hypothetical protein N7462_001348 [Penicillium macrosclerotiorum]